MARKARVVADGVPHHITQRGNNRQDVFLLSEDRRFYLETLRAKCEQHRVAILGYCLMTNHVHLVAIPERPDGLARALGETHGRYAQRFNRRYRRSGHLWQNRFYSCPLGRDHLLTALAYVDLNPLRAGLVRLPEQYEWSSARAHTAGAESDRTIDAWAWSELAIRDDWTMVLQAAAGGNDGERLRHSTYAGLPFGDAGFVTEMERRAGRPLRPKPPGPTPKGDRAAVAAG
jgi:putative transposase